MRTLHSFVFALLLSGVTVGLSSPSIGPKIIDIPSGTLD
jgi:hypothetical protein